MVTASIVIPTLHANPELLSRCRAALGDTKTIIADDPVSFAHNCNTGAKYVSGDVIVFLNDDTLPQPGWLDALLSAFDHFEVGIAGARLVYPDGRIQHAGVYLDWPGGVLTAHNELRDLPSRSVEAVTGACLAIRKTLFEDLGGFDAGFVNGYEDVDLCLRARADGWSIRYVAEATVIHYESQSGAARWSHVRENIQRLQEKWA